MQKNPVEKQTESSLPLFLGDFQWMILRETEFTWGLDGQTWHKLNFTSFYMGVSENYGYPKMDGL